MLENYDYKMPIFRLLPPEELIFSMNNFKKLIKGIGKNSPEGNISFLNTLVCKEAMQ